MTKERALEKITEVPHFDYSILDDASVYLDATSSYEREIDAAGGEELKVAPLLSALGCCYKCQFCINVILERRYRYRSAESIIEEIKHLQKEYGVNTFIFYDEDFFINKKRLYAFLDIIEEEGLKFYWRAWSRVDYFNDRYLDEEMVARLERCGLRSMVMGAESGSQKVLDMIKKGIKAENILHSAKMLAPTKITPRYSFIVGLEGEEREDTVKTYRLCVELLDANKRVDIAGPFIFRYYPGSPIFDSIVSKFDVKIPKRIDDWRDSLHEEGFMKIDEMPWVWDGCMEVARVLNKDLLILAKLRNRKGIVVSAARGLLKWRIRAFTPAFPVEVYLYDLAKRVYHVLIAVYMKVSVRGGSGAGAA